MEIRFTWDPKKAAANKKKHGITFEEAKECFLDPFHLLIADPEHSEGEERMILLGMNQGQRLLVVVHVEVSQREFRIISARRANRNERKQYEEV